MMIDCNALLLLRPHSGAHPRASAAFKRGKTRRRVALVDHVTVLITEQDASLNVALGVVAVVARWTDQCRAPRRSSPRQTTHFDRNDLVEQVDARLVIDAGVKVDVVKQISSSKGLFHLLRQAAPKRPVVEPPPPWESKISAWEVFEQIALEALHKGGGVSAFGNARLWCESRRCNWC